jgi:hypothetical protein
MSISEITRRTSRATTYANVHINIDQVIPGTSSPWLCRKTISHEKTMKIDGLSISRLAHHQSRHPRHISLIAIASMK